ncbi:TetR/AcrR family transcriptional regulator [Cryptosporangium phraense]|uniref:TetR/AcrR family transcriptional regulator n=1 Tax=Cryptosporangium phraense TaxID=2593070 RepID=A0A545AXY7_9ACTN|nr:TetR/AcrR family transcriptional regulator [Cryptosporangium phraense]TQS46203.1 TetR/AcrR family transcriptional regulator [Cryptosporangium phraense]
MNEPTRVDGRRTHDRLLAAAEAIFAEHGTDASLREISRRAGVGIATFYRHFPTREVLLEALVGQSFARLSARGAELLTAPDPAAAFADWIRTLAVALVRYDGLPNSVAAALHDPGSTLHRSCVEFRSATTELLRRAQQHGAVRADLTSDELLAAVNGMAWAARLHPDAPLDRFVKILLHGTSVHAATEADGIGP